MNDAPLMEAYAELRALAEADHVPPGVQSALFRLSECQTKLFTMVCVQELAFGAADGCIRLEPSNFLRELIKALSALDWPRVLLLVHDATSPPESYTRLAS